MKIISVRPIPFFRREWKINPFGQNPPKNAVEQQITSAVNYTYKVFFAIITVVVEFLLAAKLPILVIFWSAVGLRLCNFLLAPIAFVSRYFFAIMRLRIPLSPSLLVNQSLRFP